MALTGDIEPDLARYFSPIPPCNGKGDMIYYWASKGNKANNERSTGMTFSKMLKAKRTLPETVYQRSTIPGVRVTISMGGYILRVEALKVEDFKADDWEQVIE